jgi:hypothetical protein
LNLNTSYFWPNAFEDVLNHHSDGREHRALNCIDVNQNKSLLDPEASNDRIYADIFEPVPTASNKTIFFFSLINAFTNYNHK